MTSVPESAQTTRRIALGSLPMGASPLVLAVATDVYTKADIVRILQEHTLS